MCERQNTKRGIVPCSIVRVLAVAAVLAVLISCESNSYKVSDTQSLLAAFAKIRKSKKAEFFITVQGSIFAPPINISTEGYSGKTITINGENNGLIQLQLKEEKTAEAEKTEAAKENEETEKTEPEETCLFVIGKEVTLILESGITLKGIEDNTTALVAVDGILTMNEGSKITGNTNTASEGGGGVGIRDGGEFTLSGGIVSENHMPLKRHTWKSGGGGVWVEEGGLFTMSGGKISGNTIGLGNGGGVLVDEGGVFTLSGGTISGNTTGDRYWNGSGYYALCGGGVEDRGTFTMTGGEISGNTSTLGGGVDIRNDLEAVFTKTGGIIYGRDVEDKKNVARSSGQAMRMTVGNYRRDQRDRFRSNTVGEDVNLSTEDLETNWRD